MTSDADLFASVLEVPPEEREAFLASACPDAAQRQRLAALLHGHARAHAVLRPVVPRSTLLGFERGQQVGAYRLQEKIGEGGCGVVWMALQEAPVHRRVALKVIKLGMDTRDVIARFDSERHTLALMDHPHIAKVIDAGIAAGGQPYFVMELVRGQPITRYCDERKLPVRERLELFAQVCRAIEHAHGKGVVHRDIKPSNVLVANDGSQAVPRIIDFGIAKSLQRPADASEPADAGEQVFGTPAYMSPEQAALAAGDVGTASDVYSLGVLLYETIAGHPPFDSRRLASAGSDEARRIVREESAPRPAARVKALSDRERIELAQLRDLNAAAHAELLAGEFERVVLQAIAKSPAQRHPSAAALADEVEHRLRAGQFDVPAPERRRAWPGGAGGRVLACLAGAGVVGALIFGSMAGDRSGRSAPIQPLPATAGTGASDANGTEAAARALPGALAEFFFAEPTPIYSEREVERLAVQAAAILERGADATREAAGRRQLALVLARAALARERQGTAADDFARRAGLAAQELRRAGDTSHEAVVVDVVTRLVDRAAPDARRVSLAAGDARLRPLVSAPGAALRLRLLFAVLLQARAELAPGDEGRRWLEEAIALFDDQADSGTIEVSLRRAELLHVLGLRLLPRENLSRQQQARSLALVALAKRTDSIAARRILARTQLEIGRLNQDSDDAIPSLNRWLDAVRLAREVYRADGDTRENWDLLRRSVLTVGAALTDQGRISDALTHYRALATDGGHVGAGPASPGLPLRSGLMLVCESIAYLEAARGQPGYAREARDAAVRYSAGEFKAGFATPAAELLATEARRRMERAAHLAEGRYPEAIADGERARTALLAALQGPLRDADRAALGRELLHLHAQIAEAAAMLGQWPRAVAIADPAAQPSVAAPSERFALAIWHCLALARAGDAPRALSGLRQILPELTAAASTTRGKPRLRPEAAEQANAMPGLRVLAARARYVEALAQPATGSGRRHALNALNRADELIGSLAPEGQRLQSTRSLILALEEERRRWTPPIGNGR